MRSAMRSVRLFGLSVGTRYIRFLLLLTFSMFALAVVGYADAIQTVSIGIPSGTFFSSPSGVGAQSCVSLGCGLDPGLGGGPASGTANFNSIGVPLTFDFTTGNPENVGGGGPQYSATFGPGGSFTMTSPFGLTFTGAVTSGSAMASLGSIFSVAVDVFYSGLWSDGLPSSGEASVYTFSSDIFPSELPQGTFVSFTGVVPVPEPSSFVLFGIGTGAIGLGVLARRRRRERVTVAER